MNCLRCTTPKVPAPMVPIVMHLARWWKCVGWVDTKNQRHDGCGRAYWHDGPSLLSEKDKNQKPAFTDKVVEITSEQRTWAERL